MAENKIFAGPRIRRIRNGLGLTQTAMAEELGISPSYLNLIERNQRPLTVQLILKLSETYEIDLADLKGGRQQGAFSELKAVFSDPLISGELPGDQELVEIADAAPNAAAGISKLYRAYREQQGRLSDLSDLLAREGRWAGPAATRLPIDEVRDVFETRPNFFAAIDTASETLHRELQPGDDLMAALRAWLRKTHEVSVRVLPVQTMPLWRRRFDRHSRRLFLSERLTPADRLRETAMEVCLLAFPDLVAAEVESFAFTSAEARRLARFELLRYAAHALMMPYGAFQAAAERAAYDIDVLRGRFQVSFEQAANRLTSLQRQGAPGVPFFMLEVDNAGNRFRRAGARGFPVQRFGGGCPKLPIHAAFAAARPDPGRDGGDAGRRGVPIDRAHARGTAGGVRGAAAANRNPHRLRHRLPRRDGLRPPPRRAAGGNADRSGLPVVRAAGLSRTGRAAADTPARPRRNGHGPLRV